MSRENGTLSDDGRAALETFVTDWLSDERIPGASVAIVEGDGVAYAEGFGARDLDTNAPATADTLFGIGSVTKSFTALAIVQLVEDGELAVTDAVSDYLPHLASAPGEPVTIRDLLTHSSGMPSDGSGVALISRRMGADPMEVPLSSDADFERYVRESVAERDVDRDDPFYYYNTGYTVLGEVVRAVSGRPYADYVDEEILAPLGMERSTFAREAFEADDDAMTPYYRDDGEATEGDFPFDGVVQAPGGLTSSVTELARYLRLQMNGGALDGTRLVDAAAVAELHEPRATRRTRLDGTEETYGYGWMVSPFLGDTLVGHGGSMAVSTAYVGFLDEAELGVAVCCNTTPETHPMFVGPALLALVSGEAPTEVPYYALREKLDAVTGEYESYRGITTGTVERAGGTLDLSLETELSNESYALVPESLSPDEHDFSAVTAAGDRLPVSFDVSEDGVDLFVDRWRLHRTR